MLLGWANIFGNTIIQNLLQKCLQQTFICKIKTPKTHFLLYVCGVSFLYFLLVYCIGKMM